MFLVTVHYRLLTDISSRHTQHAVALCSGWRHNGVSRRATRAHDLYGAVAVQGRVGEVSAGRSRRVQGHRRS